VKVTFYDTIESLIDNQVPVPNRKGDGYDAARKEIHDALATPEDVEAVCHHEAAHWIYAEFLGFALKLNPSDQSLIKPVGPRVVYYAAKTPADKPRYEATISAIAVPVIRTTAYKHEIVELLARMAVAGGEATNHFFKSHKRGDTDDIALFKERYKTARLKLGNIPIPNTYLKEARDYVQTDLQRDEFIKQIHEKAEQVRQECFPLVSYTKVNL
jgi:hypothetical protein